MRLDLAEQARLALTDHLTGAANSRSFHEIAGREIERQKRFGRPLSIAYLDLDNFKAVNDTHGHETGGALLRGVAAVLKANTRATDVVARLGGDEFAVLFPETDEAAARAAAEKLRAALQEWMRGGGHLVTVSIGVATFAAPPAGVKEMVTLADELMYNAKRGGKNRVAGRQYPGPA